MTHNSCRVNIDFEQNNSSRKKHFDLDFIFFLIENEKRTLATKNEYEPDYLDFLSSLGLNTNYTNDLDNSSDWWVANPNSLKSKKLNSKVYIHKLLKKYNITQPNGEVILNSDQLAEVENDSLIRLDYSVSGNGVFKFNSKKIEYPFISSKFRSREFDLSCRVSSREQYHYITLVDDSFAFRGLLMNCFDWVVESHKVEAVTEELLSKTKHLARVLKNKYGVENFQVDSFIYKDSNGRHLEFCHEVNYRKSLGCIAERVQQCKGFESQKYLLLVMPKPKSFNFSSFKEHLGKIKSLKFGCEIYPLAPIESYFQFYLLEVNKKDQLFKALDILGTELGYAKIKAYNEIILTLRRYLQ